MLGEHPKNESIWRATQAYAALKKLYDYDSQHGTTNLQLLWTYLCNERKATETGAELHMHRNNVIYRIDRIEQIIKLDLNDANTRLSLMLSYLLLELYAFPESEGSI